MIKILLKTEEGSQEYTFHEESITLGRSSDNTLKVSDKKASRKHARIDKTGNEYRLTDLGSGNGLKVNGQDAKTHALAKGDEIRIGLSTITVLDTDTPAAAPPPAPVPAPVPAPAPAAPAPGSPSQAPAERKSTGRDSLHKRTRRSLGQRSSTPSNGKWIAIAACLCIVATVAYVLVNYKDQIFGPQLAGVTGDGGSAKKGDPAEVDPVVAAAEALKDLQSQVGSAETVTQALINKASDHKEQFGNLEPQFGVILTQLRERRAEEVANLTFPEIETRVKNALEKSDYDEAVRSLRDLRGTAKQDEAENLLKKVLEEIERDYTAVSKLGEKMEDADQYTRAADYYRTNAARFKGTQYYKKLANKPEMLEMMAEAELAAASRKSTAVAMVPKEPVTPEPVMQRPARPAPKRVMNPAPKPMTNKPAMTGKPAMKPPMTRPAGRKRPVKKAEPKPIPIPEIEAGAPPKSIDEAFASIFSRRLSEEEKNVRPSMRGKARIKAPVKRPRVSKPSVLCEAKRTRSGLFCPACQRTVDKLYDLRQGVCKRCEYEPVKIDLCLKYYFQAACHPEKIGPTPIFC